MTHDPYAALRSRDVRLYIAGNFLGTIGQQMQEIAIGWELYERTRSAFALGLVGLVLVIPVIVLALPAGQIVDRGDRRKVLLAAQALFVMGSIGLALVTFTRGPIWSIYALLALNGIANAFQSPAKGAFLPEIVPSSALSNGMTWNSGVWQLAAVLGPAAGGAVIGLTHHATMAFVLGGTGTLTFATALALIHSRPAAARVARSGGDLMSGLRYVWGTKVILATLTLDMFAVLLGGATTLLPVFAKDILHVGPGGLGWLAAAPSTGAVIVALAVAHRKPMQRAGRNLMLAVIGFGLATIGFGLSKSFWLSLALLAIIGGLDMISVVIRATLVPLLTPDEMRGRVAAINGVFIGTSNELGGFESGALASLIGPVGAVVVGGIGTIATVMAIATAWPEIKQFGKLEAPS
ncbi:MAG: MFS transporter [Gemmatimonadota bacterium]|nr:MFS transporter [Gemmatimonadota bacterium]